MCRSFYFLQDLGDVVEFAGIIHALKGGIDELVITDFEKLGHGIFKYGLSKKIIFNVETITGFPYWLDFKEVDTIEFRNPKVFVSDVLNFCRNFQHLIVNPDSVNYCVIDDVLFSKDKTQLLLYPGLKEDVEYVVPEGTLEIGSFAFRYNLFCKLIQLPTTLRKLCKNFMVSMNSLKSLSIPESICTFQFKNICHDTMGYCKIPRSIHVLGNNSILMRNAVVDATEVEYFMEDSVVCRKLIIGDRVKCVACGAFCSVKSLRGCLASF